MTAKLNECNQKRNFARTMEPEVAEVSMPIAWAELDMVAHDGVNMAEALRRIGGNDPWQDFFRNNQQLITGK